VQLVVVHVELARALERRRPEVGGEEDAIEQLRSARRSAAPLHDPVDLAPEAGQLVTQARIIGVGYHGSVVCREDLGVRQPVMGGGGRGGGERHRRERDDR
jgi:hypothetical protein